MLEQLLKTLGLNEKEISVYLAIAELGKATVQEIAKKSGLARTSVYHLVEALLEMGIVLRRRTRGATFYVAEEPNAFRKMIATQREELEKKEKSTDQLIDLISPLLKFSEKNIPRVQYFEGKDKVEDMLYENLPKWNESYHTAKDFTLWGFQDHTFVSNYSRWHMYAWENREPKQQIKLFSNEEGIEYQKKVQIQGREIRPLPKNVNFASSIWVRGEYLVMASTREPPHFAVMLKDKVLSANMRAIFSMLWQI